MLEKIQNIINTKLLNTFIICINNSIPFDNFPTFYFYKRLKLHIKLTFFLILMVTIYTIVKTCIFWKLEEKQLCQYWDGSLNLHFGYICVKMALFIYNILVYITFLFCEFNSVYKICNLTFYIPYIKNYWCQWLLFGIIFWIIEML